MTKNIQGWVCEEIMEDFFTLPMVDIIDEGGNSFMPVDESMRDKNHRYEAQGRVHANVYPSPLFVKIIDLISFALPQGSDFEQISYMQIIQYPENSLFEWHMDTADSDDTGTTILFLNDNFLGGRNHCKWYNYLHQTRYDCWIQQVNRNLA